MTWLIGWFCITIAFGLGALLGYSIEEGSQTRALQGCEQVASDVLGDVQQAEWKLETCKNRLERCMEFHRIPEATEPPPIEFD